MTDDTTRPTILIVDDEVDLLRGLQRSITLEMDCRVLLAENGTRALERLRNDSVDLVLEIGRAHV